MSRNKRIAYTMMMHTTTGCRLPALYEHALAFSVFSLGVFFAACISREWETLLVSGGGFLGIAWFPSACLALFRRLKVETYLLPVLLLCFIAGFDGVLRLGRSNSWYC